VVNQLNNKAYTAGVQLGVSEVLHNGNIIMTPPTSHFKTGSGILSLFEAE
jgi:hypothetical protein